MSEAHGIQIDAFGGPEVMQYTSWTLNAPAANEVQIKTTAIGVNFIDTYHRHGLYPLTLPTGLGLEGVGEIVGVGDAVTHLSVGDRVGYCLAPVGSYATYRNYPAELCIPLPDEISDEAAASLLLQGMTVQYLIRQIYPVQAGDTVLLHAAAGGVGLIACQWLHALGATIIGTVGSEEKAELAKAHGCTHTILYQQESVPERVRSITDGHGVPVVYDSVGQSTFYDSLDCLQPRGMMVTFGNASGPVEPVSPLELAKRGSLMLTRPVLGHFNQTAAQIQHNSQDLFDAVLRGDIKPNINQRFALTEAAACHEALESRRTTGSTIMLP